MKWEKQICIYIYNVCIYIYILIYLIYPFRKLRQIPRFCFIFKLVNKNWWSPFIKWPLVNPIFRTSTCLPLCVLPGNALNVQICRPFFVRFWYVSCGVQCYQYFNRIREKIAPDFFDPRIETKHYVFWWLSKILGI